MIFSSINNGYVIKIKRIINNKSATKGILCLKNNKNNISKSIYLCGSRKQNIYKFTQQNINSNLKFNYKLLINLVKQIVSKISNFIY